MTIKTITLLFVLGLAHVFGNSLKSLFSQFDGNQNGFSFFRLGADACDPSKCSPIPIHYEELGCEPIKKDGECCTSR